MSDTSATESDSEPQAAGSLAGTPAFDTGNEHENLRQAAAELGQRREAVAKEELGREGRVTKDFAAGVVGDYDADRLFGAAQHFRQEGEENAGRGLGRAAQGRLVDKQEISRGELRSVAREVGDNRARANLHRVMAALAERAQANQQSIADILGAEQAEVGRGGPEAHGATVAEPPASTAQSSPQNPQPPPDPAAQEHARLVAARQQYEAAIPQMAAMLLHEMTDEMVQLRARGIHSMEQLAKADAAAYARLNAKTQKFAALDQQAQAIERRNGQEQAQQWSAFAADQDRAFIAQNPAMADPGKRDAAQREVLAALRDMGIADREYAAAFDSNRVLRDARVQTLLMKLSHAYLAQKRATEALKDRRANPVPPVQRPGVSAPRPDYNQQRRAKLSEELDNASGQKALKIAAEMRALSRNGGRRGGTPFV